MDRERIKDLRWAEDLRKFHNLFFCVLPKTSFHSCLSLSPKIAFLYYTAHYPLFLILDFFFLPPIIPSYGTFGFIDFQSNKRLQQNV